MRIDVLLFGISATTANTDRVTVEIAGTESAPTVRDVLRNLHEQYPSVRSALPPPEKGRLAVNQAFAGPEHSIQPRDEVALITLIGSG